VTVHVQPLGGYLLVILLWAILAIVVAIRRQRKPSGGLGRALRIIQWVLLVITVLFTLLLVHGGGMGVDVSE
jgi:hypothetical protein